LRASVDYVSARSGPDVALLKPSPYLLLQAATALTVHPSECTFIGDSLSDIEAARTAGVRSVGYANKPGKIAKFRAAGADAVIEAITDLATT
jgi:beta-phosphoglucomutase-like phosphatase (HAD superfamily)